MEGFGSKFAPVDQWETSVVTHRLETDASPVFSGRWEERPLVRQTFHIFVLRTYSMVSSAVIEEIETEEIWARITCDILLRFQRG